MKYCKNCNAVLNDNDMFCNNCGADNSEQQVTDNQNYNTGFNNQYNPNTQVQPTPKKNPIAALVVEGIGLFFIIIGIFWLISESSKIEYFRNPMSFGTIGFFIFIGNVLLVISFILFKIYKSKENIEKLEGLALAGYVISIIGLVLTIIVFVLITLSCATCVFGACVINDAMSQIPTVS